MKTSFPALFVKRFFLGIVLIVFFLCVLKLISPKTDVSSPYYAVFLTNGQVYFGHIQKIDSLAVSLIDVYYLRANTNLQETPTKADNQETNVELSLVKLGKELHGPKGSMTINRTSVLFWEELKDTGKVVQAINTYKPQ